VPVDTDGTLRGFAIWGIPMVDVKHGKLTTTGDSLPVSILLVASEDERQSAWRRFLQQQGCTLTMVSTGAEGLELLSKQRTDVIIADVNVPEMDGLAFFEKARPMSVDAIRILAAPVEVKGRMLEAMARGILQQFLATPWNEEELRTLLDQTIHMQRDLRIQQVRKELQKMPNLPVPSRFYLKVQEMLSKEDLSLQNLAREIEQNPSFVARILQVANSVHLDPRKHINRE
jgi:response regulator RpfG family c-di-GMP phosphodiesterase